MDGTNRGGQPGNQNAHTGSLVRGAIRRALNERAKQGRDSLNIVVAKMLDDAEDGDREARRELFDRLDGKPKQTNVVQGDEEGGPVRTYNEIVIRGIDP